MPSLIVVNFKTASSEMTPIETIDYECAFEYPIMQEWVSPLAISIRSDPSPTWQPHPDLQVPFYTANSERVFVVTLWVAYSANIFTLLLFVPFSTILKHLKASVEKLRDLRWEDWGPTGTRLIKAPSGHSMVWVCYVFGSSYIAPHPTSETIQHPVGPKEIQIYDFNQLSIKRELGQCSERKAKESDIVLKPTELELNSSIFKSKVWTELPYRWRTTHVPHHEDYAFNAVMLGEDTIVTVTGVSICLVSDCSLRADQIDVLSSKQNPDVREYRIVSF